MEEYESLFLGLEKTRKNGNQRTKGGRGLRTYCQPGEESIQNKESLIKNI
jgi:hypothetical protein